MERSLTGSVTATAPCASAPSASARWPRAAWLQSVADRGLPLLTYLAGKAGDAGRDLATVSGVGDAVVEPGEHAGVAGSPGPQLHAQANRDDERKNAADQAGDGLARVRRPPVPATGERDDRDDQAHQPSHQAQREQQEGDRRHQASDPNHERGDTQTVAGPGRSRGQGLGGMRWLGCLHDELLLLGGGPTWLRPGALFVLAGPLSARICVGASEPAQWSGHSGAV